MTDRELIEKLVDALSRYAGIAQISINELQEVDRIIAEARAALAAPVVTEDAWLAEALIKLDTYTQSCSQSGVLMFATKRELFAHLRARPAVPEGAQAC